MDQPLVTIVSACYNQERFVASCVESALAQTYPYWEQLVVDDGSTDRTAEIVEQYHDPRIRCIRLPHRGLSRLAESYNTALAASRGSLVAVLEGDDAWPANKLEEQVRAFDDSRVVLSWGAAAFIDEEGKRFHHFAMVPTSSDWVDFDAADVFARLTRVNMLVPAATVLVRREALDRIGGFRQTGSSLYVDLPTWLTVAATDSGRMRFLNRELALFRVHRGQTTRRHRRAMEAEHGTIVRAVVDGLDRGTLDRLGWRALERRAITAGSIAEGVGHLAEGSCADARRLFARAFRDAATTHDRCKAALGFASAITHVDLLTAAWRLRLRVRSTTHRFIQP